MVACIWSFLVHLEATPAYAVDEDGNIDFEDVWYSPDKKHIWY